MLHVLDEALGVLPELLKDRSSWNTLAVRYETPHVNRVWIQWGEYRINLHKIFPCVAALWHPHPWPSAVKIFSGQYEMGLSSNNQPSLAKVVLKAGSSYEMVNPIGWHYVKPVGKPSMSLMVTGKPWPSTHKHPGKGLEHDALTLEEAQEIFDFFYVQS